MKIKKKYGVDAVLKAYYAGAQAKRDGKPFITPPKLTPDEKKAWQNGYREG
jgi:hypothetical protein